MLFQRLLLPQKKKGGTILPPVLHCENQKPYFTKACVYEQSGLDCEPNQNNLYAILAVP